MNSPILIPIGRPFLRLLLAYFLAFGGIPVAFAQSDTTPPEITSFTISPGNVDVTNGPKTVTITASASDDLSGVQYAGCHFYLQGKYLSASLSRTAGTDRNGTFSGTMTIPQFTDGGAWKLHQVWIQDRTSNQRNYLSPLHFQNIQPPSFPIPPSFHSTLQISSNQDTAPPAITSFICSSSSVDVTSGSKTIQISANATDNLSGTQYISCIFYSPSRNKSLSTALYRTSGSALNGTYTGTITVPRYTEAGSWNLVNTVAYDMASNSQLYLSPLFHQIIESPSLTIPSSFQSTLQITSNPDTTPPVITSFTISPGTVDVTTGSKTVTITATVTDDLAGLDYIGCYFYSPSRLRNLSTSLALTAGTNQNGTFSGTVNVPQYMEGGTWKLDQVWVQDTASNRRVYLNSLHYQKIYPPDLPIPVNFASELSVNNLRAPEATLTGNFRIDSPNQLQVSATISPQGSETTYFFQYGTSRHLGFSTSPKTAGSGTNSISVTESLKNLEAGKLYYYRIVAQNTYGSSYSDLDTFTTPSDQPDIALINGTGSEMEDVPLIFANTSTSTTREISLILRNTASYGALTNLSYNITGTNPEDFSIDALPASAILPGGIAEFTVRFHPTIPGNRSAILEIYSNDPDENPRFIALNGTGLTPYQAWQDETGSTGSLTSNDDGDGHATIFL